jgi:hypothetical protein
MLFAAPGETNSFGIDWTPELGTLNDPISSAVWDPAPSGVTMSAAAFGGLVTGVTITFPSNAAGHYVFRCVVTTTSGRVIPRRMTVAIDSTL